MPKCCTLMCGRPSSLIDRCLRAEAEAHVRALDAATDEIWVERRRIVESTHDLGVRLQKIADGAAAEFPADGEGDGDGRRTGARPGADRPKAQDKAEEEAEKKSLT